MDELLWDEIYRLRGELNAARADLAEARREIEELRENPWTLSTLPVSGTGVMGTAPLPASVWSAPVYSGTLAPYDLQAPAQILTPSYSPMRNGSYTISGSTGGNTFTITGATIDCISVSSGGGGGGTCCGPLSAIMPVPVDEEPHAIEPRRWEYPVIGNLPPEDQSQSDGS